MYGLFIFMYFNCSGDKHLLARCYHNYCRHHIHSIMFAVLWVQAQR